jgi:hypothetical protein
MVGMAAFTTVTSMVSSSAARQSTMSAAACLRVQVTRCRAPVSSRAFWFFPGEGIRARAHSGVRRQEGMRVSPPARRCDDAAWPARQCRPSAPGAIRRLVQPLPVASGTEGDDAHAAQATQITRRLVMDPARSRGRAVRPPFSRQEITRGPAGRARSARAG